MAAGTSADDGDRTPLVSTSASTAAAARTKPIATTPASCQSAEVPKHHARSPTATDASVVRLAEQLRERYRAMTESLRSEILRAQAELRAHSTAELVDEEVVQETLAKLFASMPCPFSRLLEVTCAVDPSWGRLLRRVLAAVEAKLETASTTSPVKSPTHVADEEASHREDAPEGVLPQTEPPIVRVDSSELQLASFDEVAAEPCLPLAMPSPASEESDAAPPTPAFGVECLAPASRDGRDRGGQTRLAMWPSAAALQRSPGRGPNQVAEVSAVRRNAADNAGPSAAAVAATEPCRLRVGPDSYSRRIRASSSAANRSCSSSSRMGCAGTVRRRLRASDSMGSSLIYSAKAPTLQESNAAPTCGAGAGPAGPATSATPVATGCALRKSSKMPSRCAPGSKTSRFIAVSASDAGGSASVGIGGGSGPVRRSPRHTVAASNLAPNGTVRRSPSDSSRTQASFSTAVHAATRRQTTAPTATAPEVSAAAAQSKPAAPSASSAVPEVVLTDEIAEDGGYCTAKAEFEAHRRMCGNASAWAGSATPTLVVVL